MSQLRDPSRLPVPDAAACVGRRAALLTHYRWLTFLLPLAVFLVAGSLEPTPDRAGGAAVGLAIPYSSYPVIYTLKIALTLLAMAFVAPGYRKFPIRISPLAVIVGAIGVAVWVGLCHLDLERKLLGPLGLGWFVQTGARSAYNPFDQLNASGAVWGFLAVRLFGLAVVVPVVEEFFLRGFAMRFAVDADWWNVPIGKVNAAALAVGVVLPMLMHPAELLAAAVWFSMVTWLMVKTKSIWDCVAAHAVTNLLLGIYVVVSHLWLGQGSWHLI